MIDNNIDKENNSNLNIEVKEVKKPWYNKILLVLSAIGALVLLILGVNKSNNDISAINVKIKEKKEEVKELEKKADVVEKNIEKLMEEKEITEKEVKEKEEIFKTTVKNNKQEIEAFEHKKIVIKEESKDTDANIDWVKHKFGGNISKIDN